MEKLLRLLGYRGLETNEDLARECGLTVEEVESKIANWIEEGVILGQPCIIDREKVKDAGVRALIEVEVTPERGGGFDRIAERISRFDQVASCALFSGRYDLIVEVVGVSLTDVASFVSSKLSTMNGVISTRSHFQLKVYKRSGILFEKEAVTRRLPVAP